MEIGCCHEGRGVLTSMAPDVPYSGGMISVIPASFPHHTHSEQTDFWEYLYLDPAQILRELYPNSKKQQEEKLALLNRRALLLGPRRARPSRRRTGDHPRNAPEGPYYRDVTRDLVKIFLLRLLRLNEELGVDMPESVSRPRSRPPRATCRSTTATRYAPRPWPGSAD